MHWIRTLTPAKRDAAIASAACVGAIIALISGLRYPALVAMAIAAVCALAVFWRASAVRPVAEAPPEANPPGPTAAALDQLSPLIEALPDPALLIDREGRIAGSNAAARRQLQFEASGLRLSAILRHPELLDAAQAAAQDGVSRTVAYEVTAPVEEHFKTYVAPIAWGRETAALMVFHDQTTMMATERMRARIVRPWAFAYASDVTSTADAPSVSGEEVPAVTVPSASKAGFRPESASWVVSARMVPSCATPAIGTISAVSRPSACAAAALRWLSTAICCWSARVIW